ncbi:MAG: SRPBCC family protein [Verrucomicrobiota bacterium]
MPFLFTDAVIPLPIAEVFPFFSDASNLEKITLAGLGFQILTPLPIAMEEGTIIDYRIKIGGVPNHWRSRITSWEPPYQFADEQLKGPYRKWLHTHRFEACDHGTRMKDEVEYELPFGVFGRLVHPLIRRQLRTIFAFRSKTVGSHLPLPENSEVTHGTIEFYDDKPN